MLVAIRDEFGLPVLSDVHYPEQAASAGAALDVVQIPAYLCMQTDLLEAAARTGKPVNVKRGQFIAPDIMASAIGKLEASSNRKILLTERGYAFGYNDLVVDPRSFHLSARPATPSSSISRIPFDDTEFRALIRVARRANSCRCWHAWP